MKRWIALIMVFMLAISSLYGCTKTGKHDKEIQYSSGSLGKHTLKGEMVFSSLLSKKRTDDLKNELKKEKETDPVFQSLDDIEPPPYWEEYINEQPLPVERTQELEEAFFEYGQLLWRKELAEEDYGQYAYFYGENSPYKEGTDPTRAQDVSPLELVSSRLYPSGLYALAAELDAKVLIEVEIKGEEKTAWLDATQYADEKTLAKFYPDGNYNLDIPWLLAEVVTVYHGDLEVGEKIAFNLCGLNPVMGERIVKDGNRYLIVACFSSRPATIEYEGDFLPAYVSAQCGIYNITTGKIKSYTNINDLNQYEGSTPEEFATALLECAVKYHGYKLLNVK